MNPKNIKRGIYVVFARLRRDALGSCQPFCVTTHRDIESRPEPGNYFRNGATAYPAAIVVYYHSLLSQPLLAAALANLRENLPSYARHALVFVGWGAGGRHLNLTRLQRWRRYCTVARTSPWIPPCA